MALAGRATTTIELGTSVLQTYTCHPALQVNRAASVVAAMGRPGFTLGIGPSHKPAIEGVCPGGFDCVDAGGGAGVCLPNDSGGGCCDAGGSGKGALMLGAGVIALVLRRRRGR